jgi:hypothetical protein
MANDSAMMLSTNPAMHVEAIIGVVVLLVLGVLCIVERSSWWVFVIMAIVVYIRFVRGVDF